MEDGKLLYDQKRVLGGRGYHVCPDVRCIEVLIRGKRLKRIFKVEVESLHQLKELLISEVIT
ncbi:MAG: YlxR family protein [Nitrospirae bacterium YQR-1]